MHAIHEALYAGVVVDRLTMHLHSGGPLTHIDKHHHQRLIRQDFTSNTTIVARGLSGRYLTTLEAVFIQGMDPLINKRVNVRGTLSLYDGAPLGARLI